MAQESRPLKTRWTRALLLFAASACASETETASSEDALLGIEHHPIEISDDYGAKSASAKLSELEQRIHDSAYETAPKIRTDLLFQANGGLNSLRVFVQKGFFKTSVHRTEDVMPEWREKVIHRYGATAKVHFEPARGARVNGMFSAPRDALARFSIVLPPNEQVHFGFAPALSLKFTVDGEPSKNLLLGADTFNGSIDTKNFFDVEHSNILPIPRIFLGEVLFKALEAFAGKGNANRLRLDPVFLFDSAGKVCDVAPVVPFEIRFVPTKEAREAVGEGSDDFRADLAKLSPGTRLYDLFTREKEGGELVRIGTLSLLERPITSYFGDRLFFKHEILGPEGDLP